MQKGENVNLCMNGALRDVYKTFLIWNSVFKILTHNRRVGQFYNERCQPSALVKRVLSECISLEMTLF